MARGITARLIVDDPAGLFAWSHEIRLLIFEGMKNRPWIWSRQPNTMPDTTLRVTTASIND
jgi:hypothetical protein